MTVGNNTYNRDIGKLNLDYNNQKNFLVCYLDKQENGLGIRKKYLPNNLKNAFLEKFKNKNKHTFITKEELDLFLKNNS
jgi:hypothetical protein